jgi:N-acetyl-gamma-glutamyl-phosphate reductase
MSAKGFRAAIVGVSGYSGIELAKLLARHPSFALTLAATDKWKGARLGDKIALGGAAADLECQGQEEGQRWLGQVDVAFLCTPAEAAVEIAPRALKAGTRVVDLSGGHRLAAEDYPTWYGFTHPDPELLARAVYSMPEVTSGGAARLREAALVSNPGCYRCCAPG